MLNRLKDQSGQATAGVIGVLLVIVCIFGAFALGAWLFSFHGVDAGHVAIIKQGGPFDGRSLSEVRQPGSGASAIGAFNHQYNLPVTQRDLTDEVGKIVVPTRDGVNVVIDGQALFQLKVDGTEDPSKNLDVKFFKNFGLRKWNGDDITNDGGWNSFLKIRLVPILYQSVRDTIGQYDCTQLNNTCVYVLNADAILASTNTDANAKPDAKTKTPDVSDQAKQVNTTQNLTAAQDAITKAFAQGLKDGLGDDYFEGIRFQNLRVTFEPDIQAKITAAQGARAGVATARLNAQKVAADAKGKADAVVASADGERDANKARAEGVQALARAYRNNPQQAQIEKIKALCGVDSDGTPQGCGNLTVLGGSASNLISVGGK
jgi:regulator of protease activity HflC (stomatin/prohibitin superfamily)